MGWIIYNSLGEPLVTQEQHDHTAADASGPMTNDEHDGFSEYTEIATPVNPAANKMRFYPVDVGGVTGWALLDSAGQETVLVARERVFDIPLGSNFVVHTGGSAYGMVGTHDRGWTFDDSAADESIVATVVVPSDYVSGSVIRLFYHMDSAVAGDVVWVVRAVSATEGEDFTGSGSNDSVVDTVQGTAANIGIVNITMTLTIAAGDILRVRIRRTGSSGSDTATGDAFLVGCAFVYTAFF